MQSLWIDTDAGVDDALALLVAAACPTTRLLGVSCSFGNVDRESVARNVQRVMRVARESGDPVECTEIYLGPAEPVQDTDSQAQAQWIHGVDGLGDAPDADREVGVDKAPLPEIKGGCDAGIERLCQLSKEHSMDVLMLGPSTFLHRAFECDPGLGKRLHHVYIMGGAFPEQFRDVEQPPGSNMRFEGNMQEHGMPNAEHNVAIDPTSVATILAQPCPVTFIDWALTCAQPWLWADYDRACNEPQSGLSGRWYGRIAAKLAKLEHEDTFEAPGFLVCDPLAACVCVDHKHCVAKKRTGTVVVNCNPEPRDQLGRTILHEEREGRHTVITAVHYDALNELLTQACH